MTNDGDRVMAVVHLLASSDRGNSPVPEMLVGLTDDEVGSAYRRWVELFAIDARFHRWHVARLQYLARHATSWLSSEEAEAWLSPAERLEYEAIESDCR